MGETWAGLNADGMKQNQERQQEEGTAGSKAHQAAGKLESLRIDTSMGDLFNYSGGSWRKDGREKGVWQKFEGVSLQGLLFSLKK